MSQVTFEIIKTAYEKKRSQAPKFSLRSLAKKLEVSAPFLSQIFSGKKPVPIGMIEKLCSALDIDREKRDLLLAEALKSRGAPSRALLSPYPSVEASAAPQRFAPSREFWVLQEWYYLPLLNATMLERYDGSAEFLARELGLPTETARKAIERLKQHGFLKLDEAGIWRKKQDNDFHSSAPQGHIRTFHANAITLAIDHLKKRTTDHDLDQRLITSMVLTLSENDIPWVKQEIAGFMRELLARLKTSPAEKVYQIGIQFLPCSKI